MQFASAIHGTLEGFVALAVEPKALASKPAVLSVETGVVLAIGDRTRIDLWGSHRIAGGPDHWFIGAGYVRRLR